MALQNDVWNYLKQKGLPDQSISAIMGNIQAESEFDSNLVEVGNGIGFGLCQWSFERRTQLESYGTDIQHQLDFLWTELTGENSNVTHGSKQWIDKSGYLTFQQFMHGEGSINDLTSAFCFCWERPNASLAHLDVRQTSANNYFTAFNGVNGTGTWVGGGDNPPVDNTIYCKLLFPYTFGTFNKISYKINKFKLVSKNANTVLIQDLTTNKSYRCNKSYIKLL